jgi:hypothetical protein
VDFEALLSDVRKAVVEALSSLVGGWRLASVGTAKVFPHFA